VRAFRGVGDTRYFEQKIGAVPSAENVNDPEKMLVVAVEETALIPFAAVISP
jgi:hypothetical protein